MQLELGLLRAALDACCHPTAVWCDGRVFVTNAFYRLTFSSGEPPSDGSESHGAQPLAPQESAHLAGLVAQAEAAQRTLQRQPLTLAGAPYLATLVPFRDSQGRSFVVAHMFPRTAGEEQRQVRLGFLIPCLWYSEIGSSRFLDVLGAVFRPQPRNGRRISAAQRSVS